MGLDITCHATFKRQTSEGRAQLGTDYLLFRGGFRLKIPLATITNVNVRHGKLTVTTADGSLVLHLGPAAENWAARLVSPRSLVQKLGVKPGSRVSVIGLRDPVFFDDLRKAGAKLTTGRVARESDLILLAVNSVRDLRGFISLQSSLAPDGGVWAIRPRGRPDVSEAIVMAAGKAAGLVDVKVARFSETHTAEKFVRPRNRR
jgi:hypothetical protein